MDISIARMAREHGCSACLWFCRTGLQPFGACQFEAPRTSGNQRWPIVLDSKWCRNWLPARDTLKA